MIKNVKKIIRILIAIVLLISINPNIANAADTISSTNTDNNDTPNGAISLTSKESMKGVLSSKEDVDYYKYTVDVSGYYSFTFSDNNTQGGEWQIKVYDSSLNELQSMVNNNYSCTSIDYNFKKGTVLYVKVTSYYSDTTDKEYSISVNAHNDSKWEQENNNTRATATKIGSKSPIHGNLYSSKDVDYYKYKVDVTGYYSFTFLDVNTQGGHWRIKVYDSSMNEIQSMINGEYSCTSFNYNFKKGTVLYIAIDSSYDTFGKEYSLTVNAKKNTKWEQEKNDSYSKAIALKSNTTKYGNLYTENDLDYYTYKAVKTGTIKTTFKFDAADVGYGWKISIYDSSKKLITIVNNVTADKTISFKAKKGKKYYVVIGAGLSFSSPKGITYSLKIK
jgi:hypothetical protein